MLRPVMSGSIILTTVQLQDIPDEAGDRAMGRNTMIIALGSHLARSVTAIFVVVWSFLYPRLWGTPFVLQAVYLAFGLFIAARVNIFRNVLEDRKSYRFYNVSCNRHAESACPLTLEVDRSGSCLYMD
jgi:1,4-dihydroxy-2-naphthoate octaprenyltransferase